MAVPHSNSPDDIRRYLQEVEDRLGALETPQGPIPAWPVIQARLPAASEFLNAVALVTDLKVLAVSDGVHWIRSDTGAPV